MKRKIISAISVFICAVLVFDLAGCSDVAQAVNLMDKFEDIPYCEQTIEPGEEFYNAQADFGLKLLKNTSEQNKNNLVSPLSAMICLAMVANGANGETQEQILNALCGDTDIGNINEYLAVYGSLDEENRTLKSANSIWINKDKGYEVCDEFLKTDAAYYRSGVYNETFDSSITDKVNGWVNENTDSMIEKIAEGIDSNTVMLLINALAFESKWADQYTGDTQEQVFTCTDKTTQTADMMYFEEKKYLTDGDAVGFIKPYEDGNYAFAVLLPDEGTDIDSYISSLTGESLRNIINNAQRADVDVTMPKFESDSDLKLNDALESMGMKNMFSADADFSNLVKGGGVFVDSVVQKTFIEVSESGTRAAAATAALFAESAMGTVSRYTVELNRPFLYMIIETDSNTPIFIGKLESVE